MDQPNHRFCRRHASLLSCASGSASGVKANSVTAQAETRRFWLSSALHAHKKSHTKPIYSGEMLRPLKRPRDRARTDCHPNPCAIILARVVAQSRVVKHHVPRLARAVHRVHRGRDAMPLTHQRRGIDGHDVRLVPSQGAWTARSFSRLLYTYMYSISSSPYNKQTGSHGNDFTTHDCPCRRRSSQ